MLKFAIYNLDIDHEVCKYLSLYKRFKKYKYFLNLMTKLTKE